MLLKPLASLGVHDCKFAEMVGVARHDRKRKNLSRGMHRYIHRKGKTLPVPVTTVTILVRTRISRRRCVGPKPWPVLHLSDWLKTSFISEFNGFFMLGGEEIHQLTAVEEMLTRFWSRYRYCDANSPPCPSRTIPFYIHGDEGRGLVKRPLLIVAFQPIIGWGGEDHTNNIKYHGETPV